MLAFLANITFKIGNKRLNLAIPCKRFDTLLPQCNGLSKNHWSIFRSIRDQTTVTIKPMKYTKELFYHMAFSFQSFCLGPFLNTALHA